MKFFLLLILIITSVHAAPVFCCEETDLIPVAAPSRSFGLKAAITSFASGEGTSIVFNGQPLTHVKLIEIENDSQKIFCYGIHKEDTAKVNYPLLKQYLTTLMGLKQNRITAIVGDSNKFSVNGTSFGREFLHTQFAGDHLLEYGFTGDSTASEAQLDVNSFLTEYIELNPSQAYRVVANIVGHIIASVEKDSCLVSDKVTNFIIVYNDQGINDGCTTYGDDVVVSDSILSPADGDTLIMLEGGSQSFTQAINVLISGVQIKAVCNLKCEENKRFFSAPEFFKIIKNALLSNPCLMREDIQMLVNSYLNTHDGWNSKRPASVTKNRLFNEAMQKFIDSHLYHRLLGQVEIINGPCF